MPKLQFNREKGGKFRSVHRAWFRLVPPITVRTPGEEKFLGCTPLSLLLYKFYQEFYQNSQRIRIFPTRFKQYRLCFHRSSATTFITNKYSKSSNSQPYRIPSRQEPFFDRITRREREREHASLHKTVLCGGVVVTSESTKGGLQESCKRGASVFIITSLSSTLLQRLYIYIYTRISLSFPLLHRSPLPSPRGLSLRRRPTDTAVRSRVEGGGRRDR